ncbi:MAG: 3'-5' exonuclease [Syntrophales bacterium]|jgi:DNA polymerase-3 subunit epsilon|nr:3'-5' exonuclease [Syntrophales bacterium]MCK9528311.1 3'-5' exonuclease [Syntrophales bacterium]MDX9922150.1 3'-5' exonuclease [Syntrophales bacterium]
MIDAACIDVETTGLDPRRGHRIIEVGVVLIQDRSSVQEYQSLVKTAHPISKTATRVHRITNEILIEQPGPEDVFPTLRKLIDGRVLVAHNAKFDISFLRQEFARLGMTLNNTFICTLETSRRRFPNLANHKLETIYRHLVGPIPRTTQRHRALADARMVAAVWMAMEKT